MNCFVENVVNYMLNFSSISICWYKYIKVAGRICADIVIVNDKLSKHVSSSTNCFWHYMVRI